jgi:hypothetical protein
MCFSGLLKNGMGTFYRKHWHVSIQRVRHLQTGFSLSSGAKGQTEIVLAEKCKNTESPSQQNYEGLLVLSVLPALN